MTDAQGKTIGRQLVRLAWLTLGLAPLSLPKNFSRFLGGPVHFSGELAILLTLREPWVLDRPYPWLDVVARRRCLSWWWITA
jgi:hypothetical protein